MAEENANQQQQELEQRLAQETAGLKANRDAILEEKKNLQKQLTDVTAMLQTIGGADGLKKLVEMRSKLDKDEMGMLLQEGKYEEWFDRRVAAMKADHENQITRLSEQLNEAQETAKGATARWTETRLESEVREAGSKIGVVDSAVPDILLRAGRVFAYDEERDAFVIKDKNGGLQFGKDGKNPKAMSEWLEEQKQTSRHWFPASQGAGANGNGSGQGMEVDPTGLSMSEYKKWREGAGLKSGFHNPLEKLMQ